MRACIVVPVYNHGASIGATIASLRRFGLPMILVNDGSDDSTRDALQRLGDNEALVRVFHLERNYGKGGAVMRGLREAARAGYTHALQIDADGQHAVNDVPKFLQAAEEMPEAVVCGQAVYDESVPKGRLYGRWITHFWVWIETLSFSIKDSMCGFRLYPLEKTLKVINGSRIPMRMDFDIAIIVRLVWAGAPVVNIPTPVVYPRDGVSHFHMLRDNLRISWTHTKLFFGMLRRVPILLGRKLFSSTRARHWSDMSERGNAFGILIVLYTHKLLGRRITRALMWPIVTYFFLAGGTARRASLMYLRRLYEFSRSAALPHPPTWRDSLRHMYSFADSSLDNLAAWSGRFDYGSVDFPERDHLHNLLRQGRGALLIGAHLGSWNLSRALADVNGVRTVNAIMYTDHARRYNRLLERANDRFSLNLIQVSSVGPETAISFQEKVDRGELLVIAGDRTPPAENGRTVTAPFLGYDATFAQGPFVLASILDCPVYLFFCLPENGRYRMHLEIFSDRIKLPRAAREEAIQGYARRYAERLEHYCLRAPYQWFNFYNFWSDAARRPLTPPDLSGQEYRHAGTQ